MPNTPAETIMSRSQSSNAVTDDRSLEAIVAAVVEHVTSLLRQNSETTATQQVRRRVVAKALNCALQLLSYMRKLVVTLAVAKCGVRAPSTVSTPVPAVSFAGSAGFSVSAEPFEAFWPQPPASRTALSTAVRAIGRIAAIFEMDLMITKRPPEYDGTGRYGATAAAQIIA